MSCLSRKQICLHAKRLTSCMSRDHLPLRQRRAEAMPMPAVQCMLWYCYEKKLQFDTALWHRMWRAIDARALPFIVHLPSQVQLLQ